MLSQNAFPRIFKVGQSISKWLVTTFYGILFVIPTCERTHTYTHIVNEIDLKCSWIELSHFQLVCKHFCGRYGLGCVISVLLNIVSQKRFIWHSFKCMTATAATSSPPPPSPLHSERTDIWISVVARALNKMYDYLTNEEIRTCGRKRM